MTGDTAVIPWAFQAARRAIDGEAAGLKLIRAMGGASYGCVGTGSGHE